MRFAAMLFITLILSSTISYAEDYETASATCDRLAAHPDEPGYEGKGVDIEKIDVAAATGPCEAAASSDKALGHDNYHLYRVYMAAERQRDAISVLVVAAKKGYAFAQYKLAMELRDNQYYEAGRTWMAQAAQSLPAAMAELGYLEWNGTGGPVDQAAAIEHSRQAAELGDAIGASNLTTYLEELANAQNSVDTNGQTYDEALEEVQRQEAEQRQETERQNCQYNRSFGDAAAAWSGC